MADEREREREKYYTYPALRLIQVLPGHPLADEMVYIVTVVLSGGAKRRKHTC